MSHPISVPPFHQSSPPPFDDEPDDDQNESMTRPSHFDSVVSNSDDVANENNDDWKSADENQDLPDENFVAEPVNSENQSDVFQSDSVFIEEKTQQISLNNDDVGWANFASFPESNDQTNEAPSTNELHKNPDDDWAQFESNPVPATLTENSSSPVQQDELTTEIHTQNNNGDDDDDFGEFSEVQVTAQPSVPPPPSSNDLLNSEQIESILSTCFPIEPIVSIENNESCHHTPLPSFSTVKSQLNISPFLDPSVSLWKTLIGLSNDPLGITFQWRKSNAEKIFHQALNVTERYRPKTIPLIPEILQPEKVKLNPTTNLNGTNDQGNQLSSSAVRPHFDWKQSGLENPLADNDSASFSSIISKDEDNVFDANKTLDLDFSVPPIKMSNDEERQATSSRSSSNENQVNGQQRPSIPIKTVDLYPGSTTTLNDEGKRILESLPNLSFMSAKALMFPVRFNGANQDESNSLF